MSKPKAPDTPAAPPARNPRDSLGEVSPWTTSHQTGVPTDPYQILLVEEDPKQMDLYANLIREIAQCKVDVVSGLEHTVEWIGTMSYHLVVIDLGKKSEATHLLERIKQASPMTSVIFLSERPTIEQAVGAIRLGAEDYLKKPFHLESFQLAIRRGLDRKKVFSEDSGASSFLTLLSACQMVSASMDQQRIFSVVNSYLSGELRVKHSSIYRLDDGEPVRAESFSRGADADNAIEEVLDMSVRSSKLLPKVESKAEVFRFVEKSATTPSLFVFRFRCADATPFFFVCLSPMKPASLSAFEGRVKLLKSQIEVTGKNIEQYRGVEHLVYVDDVTGLYNTRYLSHILDKEIAQAEATHRPFAVLFIDVDHFKTVNDTRGHQIGSRLLSELGAQVRREVRDSDTLFRYGGDEFVGVLPGCDLTTAMTVAERIRAAIQAHAFLGDDAKPISITVSIGVALYPQHAKSKQQIIDAADHAMYASKKRTRNQVTVAVEPGKSHE